MIVYKKVCHSKRVFIDTIKHEKGKVFKCECGKSYLLTPKYDDKHQIFAEIEIKELHTHGFYHIY